MFLNILVAGEAYVTWQAVHYQDGLFKNIKFAARQLTC